MLRQQSYQDPPPKRENDIPLGLVISIGASASKYPKSQCTADLVQRALFFCLCSCEYTKTQSHRHTTQFRMHDVQFHGPSGVTPNNTPDEDFLDAWAVTLFLDTQKNCVRGESISMEALGLLHTDEVTAATRRYIHLRAHNAAPDTPICSFFIPHSSDPVSITSKHITTTIRAEAQTNGFQKLGFFPHEIVSHSLRSDGAMALHLEGVSEHTINIIDRWHSDAFLIYL